MTIGDEVVYRISKTRTGVKAQKRDGRGLADGMFTTPHTRYFYEEDCVEGETPGEKAEQWADNKAANTDAETRVVGLGERV